MPALPEFEPVFEPFLTVCGSAQDVSTAPVALSSATVPRIVRSPLTCEKRPAAMTFCPAGSMTIASTWRSVCGAQLNRAPLAALKPARFLRAVPLPCVNSPPT